jgi:hypothetical protein
LISLLSGTEHTDHTDYCAYSTSLFSI